MSSNRLSMDNSMTNNDSVGFPKIGTNKNSFTQTDHDDSKKGDGAQRLTSLCYN